MPQKLSKDARSALRFARKYRGWHSFARDKKTNAAVRALRKRGYVEVNEYRQFRFVSRKR